MDEDGDAEPELERVVAHAPSPTIIVRVQREGGGTVEVPAPVFADIAAAYNILRAFSFQIRLSPFSLQVGRW